MASSKSGYGVSRYAVLTMPSVQSPACFSVPRVNKPLDNVWILQEATWDGSRGKVTGWDQGAVAGRAVPVTPDTAGTRLA